MIIVEDMMTARVITLSRFNTLADARDTMRMNKIRHIPIVDDENELIGIVSHSNILENGNSSQQYASSKELESIESGILLADIMTTNITTISPELNVAYAAQLVYHKKIGCLPVVNSRRQLVGIITDHDFVAITIQLLEMMEQNEPLELDETD